MSESGLYEVEMATLGWQQSSQDAQQVSASTVDLEASVLMNIYQQAQSALNSQMDDKPTNTGSSKYPTEVQVWQAKYNEVSQKWSNLENQWNTPIQAGDQELQTLGNASQQASQLASTIAQPNNMIANLLQSAL